MPGVAQAECLRYLALAMRNGAGLQQILPNFRNLHRQELKDHEDMIPDRAFRDGARRFQNIFVIFAVFCADSSRYLTPRAGSHRIGTGVPHLFYARSGAKAVLRL